MLSSTSLFAALSPVGSTMETPKGIFYWSNRASKEATINGTIGIAQDDDGSISHMPCAREFVGEAILARAPKGKVFAYAPIPGVESLRKKWLARMLKNAPGLENNATMPVVTNGITHSIALAGRLLLAPGDTILTADKSWENYEHIFTDVQGIKIATFKLFDDAGVFNPQYLIDSARAMAQSSKKVVILVNFPHNQTGFMPSPDDAKKIGAGFDALCKEFPGVSFVAVLDDAYEGYVYDSVGCKASILPHIFVKQPNFSVLKLDGISKVMLAYGYRVAFITAFVNTLDGHAFSEEEKATLNAELASKIGGFVRGEISQVSHHGQLLADALMDKMEVVDKECGDTIAMLGARWKVMMEAIAQGVAKYGNTKLKLDPCNGGFFCFINTPGQDSKVVAERLLTEKKIGVVPSAAGLRVAFAGVPQAKIPEMIQGVFEVAYSA